jgi:hypothetical protein
MLIENPQKAFQEVLNAGNVSNLIEILCLKNRHPTTRGSEQPPSGRFLLDSYILSIKFVRKTADLTYRKDI